MKPGFFCEWDNFRPEYHFFYVTGGKVKCWVKTSSTETLEFTAEKENIIYIPPYTPFGFEVIEEAQMYDMDCAARLQDLCEEIRTFKKDNEEKMPNKDELLALCKQFSFYITDVGNK